MEVGVHLFAFSDEYMAMNVTAEIENTFDRALGNLRLDGQQVALSNLTSIVVEDLPPWLDFDNSTLVLSGIAPSNASPNNVTVQAVDAYGDTANATIFIDIVTAIFRSMIETLNVTIGTDFSYDLSTYLRDPHNTSLTIKSSPPVPWISLDPETLVLSGQVPSDLQPSLITMTLNATSTSSLKSNSQSFNLSIVSKSYQAPLSTSYPTATGAGTSPAGTSTSATSKSHGSIGKGTVAAIVVSILLLVLLIFMIIAFLCYRRKKQAARKNGQNASEIDISANLETASSVVEIARPAPLAKPEPLPLDTSGFGDEGASSVYTADLNRRSTRSNINDGIRRSRTISIFSGTPGPGRKHSESLGNSSRALGNSSRAFSDSALTEIDSNNQSISDTTGFTVIPRTSHSQRLSRNYSNYSRKGHTRRSGRVWSTDRIIQDFSAPSHEATILNLRDSNFSSTPVERFSVLSSSIPEMPEGTATIQKPVAAAKTSRRSSAFISPTDRFRTGIGHGDRASISSVLLGTPSRGSIGGHGQDWAAGLARDSRTWQTMNSWDMDRNRFSYSSNASESSEPWDRRQSAYLSNVHIYPAPKNAAMARFSSVNSRPRPISRRVIDQSPFLSGRPTSKILRRSQSPRKMRTSFADSPTVAEEEVMGHLSRRAPRVSEDGSKTPQSPKLTYRSTREGTKQLRSYIQTHLKRSRTEGSIKSFDSKESRFESARSSMESVHQQYQPAEGRGRKAPRTVADEDKIQYPTSHGFARDGTNQLHPHIQRQLQRTKTKDSVRSLDSKDSRFQSACPSSQSMHAQYSAMEGIESTTTKNLLSQNDYEDDSSGSWETDAHRDSQPNVVIHGPDDSMDSIPAALQSNPVSPAGSPMLDIGTNVRMMSGVKTRRPMTMDAETKGSVRGRVERAGSEGQDYAAYI